MLQSMVVVVSSRSGCGTEDSGGQPIRTSTLSHGMSARRRHRICSIGHFTKSVFLRVPRDYKRISHTGKRITGGGEGHPSEFQTEPSNFLLLFSVFLASRCDQLTQSPNRFTSKSLLVSKGSPRPTYHRALTSLRMSAMIAFFLFVPPSRATFLSYQVLTT